MGEIKHKHLLEHCVRHLRFYFKVYDVQRDAGRLFLHEDSRMSWSWDLSFVKEMRDNDDVYEAQGSMCRFQMTDMFIKDNVVRSQFISDSK